MPPQAEHGFGGIQSHPDASDLVVSTETLARLAGAVTLPNAYLVDPRPPIRDQGFTPQCVAYSSAYEKAQQDRKDIGRWVDFNEGAFFAQIGGTSTGAAMRTALDRMLDFGYPEADSTPSTAKHRIAGYYRVDQTRDAIKRAIASNDGALAVGPWWESWSSPFGDRSTLPPPSGAVNGHAWWLVGWDAYDRFIGQNSWGTAWGDQGLFRIPVYYVVNYMWEIWKTADIETMSRIARVRINATGVTIRNKRVLGDNGTLDASHWGSTQPAGIRRRSDGAIVSTPWDREFRYKGHVDGARHGIAPYPRSWTAMFINGYERYVARPLTRLVSS